MGLSASYSRSIQLFFSGSYARVSTADSVQVWPETMWNPAAYAKQDDWVFLNLSFDFRFGMGGALPLGERTRIGLTARYTIVDAAHQQWEYYVGALQLQAFLGVGL